jgi:peptidoglycan hydrolase CwlO-like protein
MRKLFIAVFVLLFSFSLFNVAVFSQSADLSPAEREKLEKELAEIEKQIQQQQNILNAKKGEGQSISRDIAILDAQIKSAQLKIKAHDFSINKLGKDITLKISTIQTLDSRINEGRESLADILNKRNQLDSYSVAEAFLAKKNFAEFFQDFEVLATLQTSLDDVLTEVKTDKEKNETEKKDLSSKRDQEIDTKVNVENEQKKIKAAEAEKKTLLSLNQQDQKAYQGVIAQQQAKAAEIRNRLFPLRDAGAIKFEDALAYAKNASQSTGVRPAFILAILQQESNLGANVGSCYLKDETGAGTKISDGSVVSNLMKPTRDVAPFLEITKALGRDPYATRVSCPFSVGYGGAMGPSQFIPSTWMLYKARLGTVLGKAMPDPWAPKDAITATALFVSDLGAGAQTYTAERNAACRYYSGQACSSVSAFYGDQVVARANKIQADIDVLQQ